MWCGTCCQMYIVELANVIVSLYPSLTIVLLTSTWIHVRKLYSCLLSFSHVYVFFVSLSRFISLLSSSSSASHDVVVNKESSKSHKRQMVMVSQPDDHIIPYGTAPISHIHNDKRHCLTLWLIVCKCMWLCQWEVAPFDCFCFNISCLAVGYQNLEWVLTREDWDHSLLEISYCHPRDQV